MLINPLFFLTLRDDRPAPIATAADGRTPGAGPGRRSSSTLSGVGPRLRHAGRAARLSLPVMEGASCDGQGSAWQRWDIPESMQVASQGERDGGCRIRRLGLRWVRQLALLAALAPAAVSCVGQPFEAGPLGAVEVAPSEAIQIRSLQVLTGLGDLGVPSQRGVAMALEDYGPIGGRAVSMGAGLDSLCTEEGGRDAADTVTGDPRVVGVIGTSCSVAAS